jgi:hypothetical protein
MGMPPLPKSIKAPEEMEVSEGPDGFEWESEGEFDAGSQIMMIEEEGTLEYSSPLNMEDE